MIMAKQDAIDANYAAIVAIADSIVAIARQSDKIAALNLEVDALKNCLNYEWSSGKCTLTANNNIDIYSLEGDINLLAGGKVDIFAKDDVDLLSEYGIIRTSAGDSCTGTCFPAL